MICDFLPVFYDEIWCFASYGMKIGHFGYMKVVLYCSRNIYVGFRVWNKMCGDQNLLVTGIIGMPQNFMVDQIKNITAKHRS